MTPITVVAADDHPLLLAGIRATLDPKIFCLLAVASDGTGAWEACRRYRPNILLLDIQMPGYRTEEILDLLESSGSSTKVVILTGFPEPRFFQKIHERIHGYLLKSEVGPQLSYALQRIQGGRIWFTTRSV